MYLMYFCKNARYMKNIYTFLIGNLLALCCYAQTFDWAKREGLYEYDYGYGISADKAGNIYVAGKYEMTADFSGVTLPLYGNHDTYVAQYNASTGALNWIRTSGGTLGDYAHALSCDGSNVYIAGEIEGYGNVITFENSVTTLTVTGDNDIFLAKYDTSGNLAWARSAGGYHNDKALAITSDNTGNVYICGLFEDTATFSGTMITGYGHKDIYVAKYDMNGNFQWVQKAGGVGRDEALSIQTDANGNVYVCGFFSDTATFSSQKMVSPNGYYDTFLAKYASNGSLVWVKQAGGSYDDVAWSIALDNSGKIYMTGEFNAYALFDAIPLATTGNANVFVACYDAAGSVQWATGSGGPLIDRARGIGCDGTNIFITGQFGNTATFGSFTVNAADSSDIFFAGLNNSGSFTWASSVGGPVDSIETLSYESGNAICADASGKVYATGALLAGGTFGSITLPPYSRTDAFITRIAQPAGVGLTEIPALVEWFRIYPNPSSDGIFTFEMNKQLIPKIEITVYDYLGQITFLKTLNNNSIKTEIDLSNCEKGIYFIKSETDNRQGVCWKKIVVN